MKLLIASDIHGSAYYCEKLLDVYKKEKADRLVLLGDILYHGPRNDLPKDYAPKKVIGMLNTVKDDILCVRGNCEAEVDQMVLDFPCLSDYCLLCIDDKTIFVTHGHTYNLNNLPPLKKGDILLHGHTHIPSWDKFNDDNYYLNPGSTSIPKSDSLHSYMTYENGHFYWKNLLNGEVYHTL